MTSWGFSANGTPVIKHCAEPVAAPYSAATEFPRNKPLKKSHNHVLEKETVVVLSGYVAKLWSVKGKIRGRSGSVSTLFFVAYQKADVVRQHTHHLLEVAAFSRLGTQVIAQIPFHHAVHRLDLRPLAVRLALL